jgi:putative FmdB family regulatory protein
MPLIEFACRQGHHTEKIMSFAEAENANSIFCPTCFESGRRRTAKRVLSAPAVIFKGSGWTPTFHTPGESQIGGVPVRSGSDPKEIAKQVVRSNGGAKALTSAVKGAK